MSHDGVLSHVHVTQTRCCLSTSRSVRLRPTYATREHLGRPFTSFTSSKTWQSRRIRPNAENLLQSPISTNGLSSQKEGVELTVSFLELALAPWRKLAVHWLVVLYTGCFHDFSFFRFLERVSSKHLSTSSTRKIVNGILSPLRTQRNRRTPFLTISMIRNRWI
jgi:hypothetical protein